MDAMEMTFYISTQVPSPMALFYLNPDGDLMPLAIQLYQLPGDDNPVSWLTNFIRFINSR